MLSERQKDDIRKMFTSAFRTIAEKNTKLDEEEYEVSDSSFIEPTDHSNHNEELKQKYNVLQDVFNKVTTMSVDAEQIFNVQTADYSTVHKEYKDEIDHQLGRIASL
jgi:hypothetical protein